MAACLRVDWAGVVGVQVRVTDAGVKSMAGVRVRSPARPGSVFRHSPSVWGGAVAELGFLDARDCRPRPWPLARARFVHELPRCSMWD